MNYKIILTATFRNQLEQIIDYLESSFSSEIALEYLNYLEKQVESLRKFPNLGKKVCLKINSIKPTNAFISKKNIVFYRVDIEAKTITLITIATAYQNYLNLMK